MAIKIPNILYYLYKIDFFYLYFNTIKISNDIKLIKKNYTFKAYFWLIINNYSHIPESIKTLNANINI